MRIMFDFCSGLSVGADKDERSGPALRNIILHVHARKTFPTMIGHISDL